MDRCVKRVLSQGHDKSASIAICHASIVKRKERRERLLALKAERYGGKPRADLQVSDFVLSDERKFPVMTAQDVRDAVSSWGRYKGPASFESFKRRLTALASRKGFKSALPASWLAEAKEVEDYIAAYKANYGAKVGETIQGALGRGAGGRFTRAGGAPLSGRETIDALTKRGKKGGSKKPKQSEAQQAATGEKAGIDSEDLAVVRALSKAGNVSEGDAARLVKLGLAERGTDGTLRMASNARSLLRAVQGGDVQAAKDALSKGRDKASRAAEAESKRAASAGKKAGAASSAAGKKADAEAKRADAQRKRDQAAQERATKRNADELQSVTDRAEEIEALVGSDKNITDTERTKRLNQLDDLDRRLSDIGGNDELTERIGALRKQLTTTPEAEAASDENAKGGKRRISTSASVEPPAAKEFAVFKQADGRWRWLAVSSNSYRDRDGEIVTQKALEADAERMTATGEYGPLRFWHVGKVVYDKPLDWTTAKAGPGLDIGTCDFSVMHGRLSVEGGEVYPQFGPGLAANDWQTSRGFAHPMGHPVEKAYDEIRSFERSPLPVGSASNPFTSLTATEVESMASLNDKMKEFAAKFFNGDEAKAQAYADGLTTKDKEIESAGVAFKEGEGVATAEAAPDATTEAKADGDMPEAEGDAVFVGDMVADEFAAMLTNAITSALAPMLEAQAEMGKRVEAAETTAKEAKDAIGATGEAVTSMIGGFTKLKEAGDASLAQIDKRVKELEGDAPGQKGYRASADKSTITTKQMTAPQAPDDLARMAALLYGSTDAGTSA